MHVPRALLSLPLTLTLGCPPAGQLLRVLGLPSARKTSSTRPMDHLQRTAANSRQQALYPAQVCGVSAESSAVKRLRLSVFPGFSFKAGQWVDMFIPGLETVGGFSMCSSPGLLQREGVIELAVKYTEHPPANWVHTQCTIGSRVELRVGGDFFFDPAPSGPALDLLLLAGGVGINPLYSILLHTADLLRAGRGHSINSAHICYSAKNTEQLLFKSSIRDVVREFPLFSCGFHVTEQNAEVEASLEPVTSRGRITAQQLQALVRPQTTLCYLCGPPPMIQALSHTLLDLGLPPDRVLFEKWW